MGWRTVQWTRQVDFHVNSQGFRIQWPCVLFRSNSLVIHYINHKFTARHGICGKVKFSVVSVIVSHMTITHDWNSPHKDPWPQTPVQRPPWYLPSSWRGHIQNTFKLIQPHCTGIPLTYSNLFNLDHTEQGHTPTNDVFTLIHYEARMIGKRAVDILLEGLLVLYIISTFKT